MKTSETDRSGAPTPGPALTPTQVCTFLKGVDGTQLALLRRLPPSLDGRRTALPGGYPGMVGDNFKLVDRRLS